LKPELKFVFIAFLFALIKSLWLQCSLDIVDTLMHGQIVHYNESWLHFRQISNRVFKIPVVYAAPSSEKWELFSERMLELNLIR
jgi:hypothetical protein